MKGLVSYGASESENSESESDEKTVPAPKVEGQKRNLASFLKEKDTFGSSVQKSNALPSFRPDASGKVKIMAPKFDKRDDDSDDDTSTSRKQVKVEDKPRCALFSVLPPPKFSSNMIPAAASGRRKAIVTEEVEWGAKSKPMANKTGKVPAKSNVISAAKVAATEVIQESQYSSDEDEPTSSFFSIDQTSSKSIAAGAAVFDYGAQIGPSVRKPEAKTELSGIFDQPSASRPSKAYKKVQIDVVEGGEEYEDDDEEEPSQAGYQQWLMAQQQQQGMEASSSVNVDEIRKVAGRHNKGESINIVDFKADDILDPAEFARQRAIDEMKESMKEKNNMMAPRGRAKSRHQITYLAWLAKEKETELKEFWAASNMNKTQSKMKYGF